MIETVFINRIGIFECLIVIFVFAMIYIAIAYFIKKLFKKD